MSSYAAEAPIAEHEAYPGPLGERLVLRDLLAAFEKNLVFAALIAAGGNQKRAAAALGVLPSTLSEKLKRFSRSASQRDRALRRERGAARPNPLTEPRREASTTTSFLEKKQ